MTVVVAPSGAGSSATVDAVDVLDASFHNLTTVDENKIPPPEELGANNNNDDKNNDNNAVSDDAADEDFQAFKVCSKRLKEKEELDASLSKIEKDPVTEHEKVEQKQALAALKEDIKQGLDPTLAVLETKPIGTHPDPHDPKRFVSPKDFELLKVIGMGAFGKVLQVRNRTSGKTLAMKVISKRLLNRKHDYVENVQAERNILTRVKHPFVVMMHCVSAMLCFLPCPVQVVPIIVSCMCSSRGFSHPKIMVNKHTQYNSQSFQTKYKLFIIMDFLAGGELFLRLGREGIFLEKQAAFYLAEIILALEFLHNLGTSCSFCLVEFLRVFRRDLIHHHFSQCRGTAPGFKARKYSVGRGWARMPH